MKFSTRTTYGLQAVLFLASRFGEGSVSVSQISKKEGISTAYLEQILNALKKKGLVKTLRGPQGGYVLAKKPSEITLEELFYALAPAAFSDLRVNRSLENPTDTQIAERLFWKKLKGIVDDGLKSSNIQNLLQESRKLKKDKTLSDLTFHI